MLLEHVIYVFSLFFQKYNVFFSCRYSKRSNISRARNLFHEKKKHFLLFTERFYFFYRYVILHEQPNFYFEATPSKTSQFSSILKSLLRTPLIFSIFVLQLLIVFILNFFEKMWKCPRTSFLLLKIPSSPKKFANGHQKALLKFRGVKSTSGLFRFK